MRKAILIISRREYLERIKQKSFWIITIIMPFLLLLLAFLPEILELVGDAKIKRILVIDQTDSYGDYLTSTDEYHFDVVDSNNSTSDYELTDSYLFGTLQIRSDLSIDPTAAVFITENAVPDELTLLINSSLSEAVKIKRIERYIDDSNIDFTIKSAIKAEMYKPVNIAFSTIELREPNASQHSTIVAVLMLFLMMFIISYYGSLVLNSVVEEKSSRIVEVLLCSVKPVNLLMGKVIGIGLVCLTQLFVWFVFILVSQKNNISELTFLAMPSIDWLSISVYFCLFLVGGYLLFASLFASFGAMTDNAQDAQQLRMPLTFVLIISMWVAMYSLDNPNSEVAFWASIIPFTSPVVMISQILFGVSAINILMSIAALYVSAFLFLFLASKIYRVGVLMYGTKSSLKEIIKCLFI